MHDSDLPTTSRIDIGSLRDQASAALDDCQRVGNTIRQYQKYLELSRDYRVRMVGPFLVIEGGLAENPPDVAA
jgi:hypothetical protein